MSFYTWFAHIWIIECTLFFSEDVLQELQKENHSLEKGNWGLYLNKFALANTNIIHTSFNISMKLLIQFKLGLNPLKNSKWNKKVLLCKVLLIFFLNTTTSIICWPQIPELFIFKSELTLPRFVNVHKVVLLDSHAYLGVAKSPCHGFNWWAKWVATEYF